MLLHILEEGNSALQLPSVDGLGGLTSVLEGHSEVGTAGAGRLLGEDLLGSVSNLFSARSQSVMLQERKYSKFPRRPQWRDVIADDEHELAFMFARAISFSCISSQGTGGMDSPSRRRWVW